MRYYTKEWYIKAKAAGLCLGLSVCTPEEAASKDYYEKLFAAYADDVRFECEQIKNTSFDVFAEDRTESEAFLRAEFERRLKDCDPSEAEFIAAKRLSASIENLKLFLPAEIISAVPDIRILALHRTSRKIFDMLESYSDKCRTETRDIEFAFEEEYSSLTDDIPDEIWQEYGFSGGRIKKIITKDNNIDMMIDNYGTGSDVTAVHLEDASAERIDDGLEGAEWIMNELYLNNGIYTLCALCRKKNTFPEFIIKAKVISFSYDR